jgi:hypothetical protein
LLRFAAAALLLGAAAPARALTVPFIDVYTETVSAIGAGAGGNASVTLETGHLFPSALGALEDVDLLFSGSVNFIIAPGLNPSPGPAGTPVPYTIAPQLSIEINGLPNLYDLAPFAVSTAVLSTGLGESSGLVGSYSFGFSYNETLGLFTGPHSVSASGPVTLAPPATLAGQLDDFVAGLALTNLLNLSYSLSFTEFGRISSVPTVVTTVSVLQVTTTYTYSVPAVSIPEPGGAHLLVVGLLALVAARRAPSRLARRIG